MSDGRALAISEVIALLKEEFPDVTISKLRFLESQGLLRPGRSSSGYRQFRAADVERARYILRQQRDHFLPLKVIRGKLSVWEQGEEPTVAPAEGAPPDAYFGGRRTRMSAEELARAGGVPLEFIRQLVQHGIIRARSVEGTPEFTDDDAVISRAANRLVSRGLEVRHLRTLRLAANRETDLLAQLASPLLRHHTPAGRRRAAEVLADCAQAARELQEASVRSQLRELLEG